MSRIGRMPIALPSGVKVNVADGSVRVEGPKGKLARALPPEVSLAVDILHAKYEPHAVTHRERAGLAVGDFHQKVAAFLELDVAVGVRRARRISLPVLGE